MIPPITVAVDSDGWIKIPDQLQEHIGMTQSKEVTLIPIGGGMLILQASGQDDTTIRLSKEDAQATYVCVYNVAEVESDCSTDEEGQAAHEKYVDSLFDLAKKIKDQLGPEGK